MDPRFQIKAEWPERPAEGQPDIAHLSLWSGETALTQLADLDRKENRPYFRASAVSLALWITDNWWRLRHEPVHDSRQPSPDWRMRHELSSISGGFLWPPLMIYGTGARVVISPSYGANTARGPVRYLELESVLSVDGRAYEASIDAFLATVVKVCAGSRDGEGLTSLVGQLHDERADEETAAWRRLEARLGFDPDRAPAALMERLAGLEDSLGERGVEEAAVSAPGAQAGMVLEAAIGAARASEIEVDLSIADAVDPKLLAQNVTPWRAGEEAARVIRRAIGKVEGPLDEGSLSKLASRSWAEIVDIRATAHDLPYAARLATVGQDAKLALQNQNPTDRRYEMARIVADQIWARGETFGVVSRAKTERQKFQRAFAQSLAVPFDELPQMIDFDDPTDEQIADAAERYVVRPSVVNTALRVKGVLPRESLSDRLEYA